MTEKGCWIWGLSWIMQLRMTPRTTSRPLCFGPKFLAINRDVCCGAVYRTVSSHGIKPCQNTPTRPRTPRATHLFGRPPGRAHFFWQSASELETKVNYLWTSLGPPSSVPFERAPCQVSSFKDAQRDSQAHSPPSPVFLRRFLTLQRHLGSCKAK